MNLKNKNIFKVLDFVTFEIGGHDQKNLPRWSKYFDYGGSGIWAKGVVREVTELIILVEYEIEGYVSSGESEWPNYAHENYRDTQWSRDGYLRKIKCECGAEATKTTHSRWCPSITFAETFEFIKV